MNISELLVIIMVAIVVFGPTKLPMLAKHLGKFIRQLNYLRVQAADFWQTQLNEQKLRENQERAGKADILYKEKSD
jgi:sec-independent protein translocase protein TatB